MVKSDELHPLANAYPRLPDDELNRLTADMEANGYDPRFPVVLYEGKILDGRNRQIAAGNAEVEPVYVELPADADPEAFVERANEHRRHLTPDDVAELRRNLRGAGREGRREAAAGHEPAGHR